MKAQVEMEMDTDINSAIREALNDYNNGKIKKGKKKRKKENRKNMDERLLPVLNLFPDESEFNKIIIDNIKVFESTEGETPWGDPVASPQIRRNKASNLYGEVRYNEDGTKRWHHGFDIKAPVGTPIMSVCAGTVRGVGNNGGYGLCVLIEHKVNGKSYFSFYAHLSSASVKSGQNVKKGSVIGHSGTTGNAAGMKGEDEHVHVEYRTSAHGGARSAKDPNTILRTKFYSADPSNKNQSNVSVIRKYK